MRRTWTGSSEVEDGVRLRDRGTRLRLRAGGDRPGLELREAGRSGCGGGDRGGSAISGTPYGSDVRNLVNDGGIEAITFGPGNVAECHCADERVSIAEVREAALVTTKVATELLLA